MADQVTPTKELIERTRSAVMLQAEALIPEDVLKSGAVDEFLEHTINVQAYNQAYSDFQTTVIHRMTFNKNTGD